MMPSPSELRYFLEVANTLNLSRAAERLGISQPALTLAIKRLEDTFGQPVLIRSKTGVRLTRSGIKLVARVRLLLEQWDKLKEEVDLEETEVRGTYSIGCHPSVALYTLEHFVPELLAANPFLEIKLFHDLSRKITEDVISCRIDFGLVINPPAHPDLIIKPLLDDEVAFWVGPKKSELQDPESGKAVLICDQDLSQVQSLQKQVQKMGLRFGRIMTSPNLEVITALVASGAGIGILPARVAMRDSALGLKPLIGKLPKFQDRCCLIYRVDMHKTSASREMVKFISEKIKTVHG